MDVYEWYVIYTSSDVRFNINLFGYLAFFTVGLLSFAYKTPTR